MLYWPLCLSTVPASWTKKKKRKKKQTEETLNLCIDFTHTCHLPVREYKWIFASSVWLSHPHLAFPHSRWIYLDICHTAGSHFDAQVENVISGFSHLSSANLAGRRTLTIRLTHLQWQLWFSSPSLLILHNHAVMKLASAPAHPMLAHANML